MSSHSPQIIFLLLVFVRTQCRGRRDGGCLARADDGSAWRFNDARTRTLVMNLPNKFQDVAVLYGFRSVGQCQEVTVDLIELVAIQPETQFFAAQPKSVASRVFTQNETRAWNSHGLRGHDFIG